MSTYTQEEVQSGRQLFAELLPAAPIDLYDRIDDVARDCYIEEAKRRSA